MSGHRSDVRTGLTDELVSPHPVWARGVPPAALGPAQLGGDAALSEPRVPEGKGPAPAASTQTGVVLGILVALTWPQDFRHPALVGRTRGKLAAGTKRGASLTPRSLVRFNEAALARPTWATP